MTATPTVPGPSATNAPEHPVAPPGSRPHPSDAVYIAVAVTLAALTMMEVGIYYLQHSSMSTVGLLALMLLKFGMVAGFFMHLRFDSPLLRRLFVFGLILAASVYSIVLFAFGVLHV